MYLKKACLAHCNVLFSDTDNSEASVKSRQSIRYTHDVSDSTPALHLSILLPLPSPTTVTQTLQPASQPARCISSSCVLEAGTGCLCRVARWPRPRSYTKEALFRPEPAALRAVATEEAVTQRNTRITRIPQNKTGSQMLTPLCFPHSGRSVCTGQLLRSLLGPIHRMSCSFKLTGGKFSWTLG